MDNILGTNSLPPDLEIQPNFESDANALCGSEIGYAATRRDQNCSQTRLQGTDFPAILLRDVQYRPSVSCYAFDCTRLPCTGTDIMSYPSTAWSFLCDVQY
eukprot:3113324-Rhodomonas_salina.4